MIAQRTLVLALLSFVLAACGGGGSDNAGGGTGTNPPPTTPPGGNPPTNPPPSGPSADELSAQNAKLRIYQDADLLSLIWEDMFDNELAYRLERRSDDGTWLAVNTHAAGDGGFLDWFPIINASGTYRVVAVLENGSMPLHAALNETQFAIDIGPSPMTIDIDQAEPVRGTVQVSVQNAGPALSVTYMLDNLTVAESTGGGTFTATIPAERLLDGQHRLIALVQRTEGLWRYQERSLQAANSAPALLMTVTASRIDLATPVTMIAEATAPSGILSVAFFVNDNPLTVVSTPNASGQYRVNIDRATLPSGWNVFRALATDNSGNTFSMEQRFTIDHFPALDIEGLFDGMIAANGRLELQGTFSDDHPGATLTILVGGRRIVQTQTSPLTGSYSLEGVPPGDHPAVVRVRDSSGRVNVRTGRLIVSSTQLNYELLATDAAQLLAADQGSLLYKKHSGAIVLKAVAGTETQLPPASAAFREYALTAGRVVAWGHDNHIYVLDANGQPTDVSQANTRASGSPQVDGPWVSWRIPTSQTFQVYNLQTGASQTVIPGSPVTSVLGYDLDATPGSERLLLSAGTNNGRGVFSYNLTAGTTQLVLDGVPDAQIDGARISWISGSEPNANLLIAPVSNPSASTMLATDAHSPQLDGGLVHWIDRAGVLHVNDGSSTTRLSGFQLGMTVPGGTLRDGHFLFRNDEQTLAWSPASGERVWLDAVPSAVIHSDGVAYFLTGSSGTLYRVTLP